MTKLLSDMFHLNKEILHTNNSFICVEWVYGQVEEEKYNKCQFNVFNVKLYLAFFAFLCHQPSLYSLCHSIIHIWASKLTFSKILKVNYIFTFFIYLCTDFQYENLCPICLPTFGQNLCYFHIHNVYLEMIQPFWIFWEKFVQQLNKMLAYCVTITHSQQFCNLDFYQ